MDWEALGAIGELLGSIGVLITIVYFGMQLKRMQTSEQISIQSGIAQARIGLHNQRIDHMDLLVKANSGNEIGDVEVEKLRNVYGSEASTMFFAYLNFRNLGQDGQIQARNFARYIRDNPGLERFWVDQNEYGGPFHGMSNPAWKAWSESVDQHLKTVKAQRRAD